MTTPSGATLHVAGRKLVYKIVGRTAWDEACAEGSFKGSSDDVRDGFIHLSSAEQVSATLAKHFKGKSDLLLIMFDVVELGDQLAWERSRGGELFPHLYGQLSTAHAVSTNAIPVGADGTPYVQTDMLAC